jgi:sulfur relay (sulfurtransferase) complex TusBCD TusD component (DsrE family)
MKLLVIVTTSPWAGSLAGASLRFVRAAREQGHEVPAVYFREEGVYHAIRGRMADSGTERPSDAWIALAGEDTQLLLCSAASSRRLDSSTDSAFREAGLARMWALAAECDRVVTF